MAWNSEMVTSKGNMLYHNCKISSSYANLSDYDIKYSSTIESYVNIFGNSKKLIFYNGSVLRVIGSNTEQKQKYEYFYNNCIELNTDTSIAGKENYKTILSVNMGNFYFVCSTQYTIPNLYMRFDFVKDLKEEYSPQYFADTSKCIEWGNTSYSPQSQFIKYGIYSFNALDDNGKSVQGFGLIRKIFSSDGSYVYDSVFSSPVIQNLWNMIDATPDIIETSDEFGNESTGGGYGGGSFDDSSDHMGLPELPSIGVSDTGFINVYKITKNELKGFVDELFPDFEIPTPSTATGIEAVAENLANTVEVIADFANSYINKGLVEYVIDCHIVPVTPTTLPNTGLKVGFKTFSYNPSKVTSDYVSFDCGSLTIPEYYQNFLDYSGTRAKLYLPFIGFVDVKAEWFQSGKLQVIYHFNIIDGSCIAYIIGTSSKSKLTDTVVATFGGNCCVHMPITGINYSSMISGIAGGVGQVASGIATGSMSTAIRGLENAVSARPDVQQSNGYNAGMSFMSYRQPYLLIERAVASFSKNYTKEQGLPLNATKKLGSMKGFTTCTAPVVDNFHCLEEEKEMIKQALIEGTIF